MSVLIGVIVLTGLLCWTIHARREWVIPHQWQVAIEAWKERQANKTHIIIYDWHQGPENSNLERHLWQLRREFPRTSKRYSSPLKVKVHVQPDLSSDQTEAYIACLQRRFPEIQLSDGLFSCESSKEEKLV